MEGQVMVLGRLHKDLPQRLLERSKRNRADLWQGEGNGEEPPKGKLVCTSTHTPCSGRTDGFVCPALLTLLTPPYSQQSWRVSLLSQLRSGCSASLQHSIVQFSQTWNIGLIYRDWTCFFVGIIPLNNTRSLTLTVFRKPDNGTL